MPTGYENQKVKTVPEMPVSKENADYKIILKTVESIFEKLDEIKGITKKVISKDLESISEIKQGNYSISVFSKEFLSGIAMEKQKLEERLRFTALDGNIKSIDFTMASAAYILPRNVTIRSPEVFLTFKSTYLFPSKFSDFKRESMDRKIEIQRAIACLLLEMEYFEKENKNEK